MPSELRSSFVSLPTEILASIFYSSCSESLRELGDLSSPSGEMKQLSREITSLRLLSSRCDAVATSTPSLWANMHIFLFDSTRSPPMSILARWLERSASLLLNLKFTFPHNHSDTLKPRPADITCVLSPSITRWRSAQFWFRNPFTQIGFLLELPFASATSLRFLRLWCIPDYDKATAVSLLSHLETIPSPGLLSLVLTGAGRVVTKAIAVTMPLTLAHTRRLHLRSWSRNWMDVWRACQLCTSATWISLIFGDELNGEHGTEAPSTSTLPNLNILEVNIYTSRYSDITRPILPGFIHTPNLKLLFIKQPEPSDFPIAERIVTFVQVLGCSDSLHVLRVSGISLRVLQEFLKTPQIMDIPTVVATMGHGPITVDLLNSIMDDATSDGRALGFVQSEDGDENHVGWMSDAVAVEINEYLIDVPLPTGLPVKHT